MPNVAVAAEEDVGYRVVSAGAVGDMGEELSEGREMQVQACTRGRWSVTREQGRPSMKD